MIKEVEISSCCEIISGSTPSRIVPDYWDGDINWFTPKDLSNLSGKYIDEAPEKITEQGYKSCSTNLLPPFSLMLSSRAPIGHLAINTVPACTNQGFKSLVPKSNVAVNYLYYAIKRIVPMLQDLGNGATFKELSKSTLSKVKISLPPLETQRKIAGILDAADTLRQKTKTLIEKYDQLTQSLFLDMFGDPLVNPKKWDIMEIKDLASKKKHSIKAGPFGSSLKKEFYVESGYKIYGQEQVIRDDLNYGNYYINEFKYKELENCKIQEGDILISLVGTYGKISIVPKSFEPGIINPRLMKITPDKTKVRPDFLKLLLQSTGVMFQLQNKTRGGTMDIINTSIMKKISVPIPPLPLQNQFAERVQAIEVQKAKAQESFDKAEELFQSLLQKAFNGEIN